MPGRSSSNATKTECSLVSRILITPQQWRKTGEYLCLCKGSSHHAFLFWLFDTDLHFSISELACELHSVRCMLVMRTTVTHGTNTFVQLPVDSERKAQERAARDAELATARAAQAQAEEERRITEEAARQKESKLDQVRAATWLSELAASNAVPLCALA